LVFPFECGVFGLGIGQNQGKKQRKFSAKEGITQEALPGGMIGNRRKNKMKKDHAKASTEKLRKACLLERPQKKRK